MNECDLCWRCWLSSTCSHLLMCQRITVRWLSTHETVFCGMYFKVSYKFGRKVSNIVNLSEARYSTAFFPTVWFLKGELWRLMLCNWNLWSEVNEVKNKDIGRGRVWYRCNSSLRFHNFICNFFMLSFFSFYFNLEFFLYLNCRSPLKRKPGSLRLQQL